MMLWKIYSLLIAASKRLSRKGIYSFLDAEISAIPAGSKVLAVGAGGPTAKLARRLAEEKGLSLILFDVSTEYKSPDIVGDICYCSACFSGNYPVPLPEEGKEQLKLFEKVRE